MPKYLFHANYVGEGIKGLLKDGGSKRRAVVETLFQSLGASSVDSMDNSDFEGARLVHDLNQPIPADWKGRYDAVIDGGTLEHVFNFPVALRNVMEMVQPGGRLFIHNCANNLCGHGFYQFSPELFFRVLSPANGFQMQHCVAVEYGVRRRWFAAWCLRRSVLWLCWLSRCCRWRR